MLLLQRACRLVTVVLVHSLLCGLAAVAQAQDNTFAAPSPVVVDVCSGEVKVVSQQQNGSNVELEVEITVNGCDGVCTGTLEYGLVFTDASGNDIQWQLTDSWDWRDVKAPFTLKLQQQALPNAKLKEVRAMKIGRCSCSTVKA
jgi:hypothetical protein